MASSIERSALVWHPAARMYDIVNDVAAYPEFLPWCSDAEVHETGASEVLASLEIAKGSVRHRFTTRNRLIRPSEIRITLVDGPFARLEGSWYFMPLATDACKVLLKLDFEFAGPIARMALGSVFNQAASSMVEAFCQRADSLIAVKSGMHSL